MSSRPARIFTILAGAVAAVLGVAGVVWIATTYATQGAGPVPDIGNFNLLIGMALVGLGLVAGMAALVGLVLTRR